MLAKRKLIVVVVCLALLANGCGSHLIKELSSMRKLQQHLIDKYHDRNITVHLQNSAYLSISFVNSPLNQQSEEQRRARAAEAAKFVAGNFDSIQQIQAIWVYFVATETRLVVFNYSRTVGVFAFNNHGEPAQPGESAPRTTRSSEDALSPDVKYDAERNESYVSLMRIQLAGAPDHDGLSLVPYFIAAGNVRGPRRAVAPKSVDFDFASYSRHKLFTADVILQIACDSDPEFRTSARLLSSQDTTTDGGTAQFLEAKIPFAEFVRIGRAKSVRVQLGDMQYELKSDEIAALKRLADLVSSPASANR